MSDMADYTNEIHFQEECLAEEYISGDMSMEEAYDNGFIDEQGVETSGMQSIWDNSVIYTADNIGMHLDNTLNEFDLAAHRHKIESTMGVPSHLLGERESSSTAEIEARISLTNKAVFNLTQDSPTCNICSNEMITQEGKFGKFYFCKCEGQPTVSDKYWQSVRIKGDNL